MNSPILGLATLINELYLEKQENLPKFFFVEETICN